MGNKQTLLANKSIKSGFYVVIGTYETSQYGLYAVKQGQGVAAGRPDRAESSSHGPHYGSNDARSALC